MCLKLSSKMAQGFPRRFATATSRPPRRPQSGPRAAPGRPKLSERTPQTLLKTNRGVREGPRDNLWPPKVLPPGQTYYENLLTLSIFEKIRKLWGYLGTPPNHAQGVLKAPRDPLINPNDFLLKRPSGGRSLPRIVVPTYVYRNII